MIPPDIGLGIDIIDDIPRDRTPFRHMFIRNLHTVGISFVEKKSNLTSIHQFQERIQSFGIEIRITGRITRIVDQNRRILTKQIPKAATIVE